MHVDVRLITSWTSDVLIAYAAGLVLGAPIALIAGWLTCRDGAATVSLLAVMSALFVSVAMADGRRSGLARVLGAFPIWVTLLWLCPGVASSVLRLTELGALYVVARG